MSNFAIIGAAGYIAPRHMRAIAETGNQLTAALDPNDSVGILDSYFPDCRFFTEFERFDRYVDLLKTRGNPVDYVAITSPNYLHDSHVRFGLRIGADVICEKPLVINPWNLEALQTAEENSNNRVYTILQLRLHQSIINLKARVQKELKKNPDKVFNVDLTYLTSRGHWYFSSWKGEEKKSGGIVANIGVHFFDMLQWVFGDLKESHVHSIQEDAAAGFLDLEHAKVQWFLSVNAKYLPKNAVEGAQRTYRSITVDGEELEFSGGFTELHNTSYRHIFDGQGFGLADALPSIELVHAIRTGPQASTSIAGHPLSDKLAQTST